MKRSLTIGLVAIVVVFLIGCGPNAEEKRLKDFIANHVEKIQTLQKEANLAYWDAAVTGHEQDYKKYSDLDLEIRKIYSDTADFGLLKTWKESGQIKNPLLVRQVETLYDSYLENQMDPGLLAKIVSLGAQVEQEFSTFRATLDGKKVTSNEIDDILKTETDSRKRREAWMASKQVGNVVAADLIALVKLRNQAAQKMGFDNYHTLSLTAAEQNVEELDKIFDELYRLTAEPYANMKEELDNILADNYGIGVEGLMPWHYHDPFFQEAPLVYELNLDTYYANSDVKQLAASFYDGIGLNVESILERSDLYEKEGKNPHAFCTDIDRQGDVRILCNVKNNERWMGTMLHELGHAVYDKFQNQNTPYLLRQPAHIFTTEAIAMFFERLSRNAVWMEKMLALDDSQRVEQEKVTQKYARMKQLIFARWAMVMYSFEKQLYADPDQDLNALWWDTVEKFQLVKKPTDRNAPDWAAKIHFAIAPCYYHNYLLGELLASQLHNHIVHKVLNLDSDAGVSYVNERKVGDYLRKNVFQAGAIYPWNEMIRRATGTTLTPTYFVQQYVQ
jgi:peptidyl-dipeptidase A